MSGSDSRRPKRPASPIGLLVLSLVIACRAASRPLTPEPLPVDAQCFAVSYQPHQTDILPATVALARLGVATDSARAYWRNSPEDTAQYGPMLYGTWRWLGTGRDSVVVRFTSGFSGADLVLGGPDRHWRDRDLRRCRRLRLQRHGRRHLRVLLHWNGRL